MDDQCLICGKLNTLGYCDFCLCSIDVMHEQDFYAKKWLYERRTQLIIELLCLIHNWQGWYINRNLKCALPCKRKLMLFPRTNPPI